MDEFLHRFETMGSHCLLVFTGNHSFRGFLGGAGFCPSTVLINPSVFTGGGASPILGLVDPPHPLLINVNIRWQIVPEKGDVFFFFHHLFFLGALLRLVKGRTKGTWVQIGSPSTF